MDSWRSFFNLDAFGGHGGGGSFIPKEQRGIKKSEVQDQREPEVGTCAAQLRGEKGTF